MKPTKWGGATRGAEELAQLVGRNSRRAGVALLSAGIGGLGAVAAFLWRQPGTVSPEDIPAQMEALAGLRCPDLAVSMLPLCAALTIIAPLLIVGRPWGWRITGWLMLLLITAAIRAMYPTGDGNDTAMLLSLWALFAYGLYLVICGIGAAIKAHKKR